MIEHSIQKGFTPGISGTYEHTAHMAHLINTARRKQRSLVITLIDLKNAFGEVHHNLIKEVNNYHKIPQPISDVIDSLYKEFNTSIITPEFRTPFIEVGRGVLQGDCLSPIIFNMCINTFIQYIKADAFQRMGYSSSASFTPRHWFQFADDASVVSGLESENQVLLNAFTRWCQWSEMIIRIDKCVSFGMVKKGTKCQQFQPKLYVNNSVIPQVKKDENFKYLGRYYNFEMEESKHRDKAKMKIEDLMTSIDALPLHPKNKTQLYKHYVLSKISWDLTIANLGLTWVRNNLDNVVASYLRRWIDIPINGTLDICLLSKDKFGLDIMMPSTKFTLCQTVLRNCLKNSPNEDVKKIYEESNKGTNVQFDRFNSTREALKSIRNEKEQRIENKLVRQGMLSNFLVSNIQPKFIRLWSDVHHSMPKNIFNFAIRFLNNTLANRSNMVLWGQTDDSRCTFCKEHETLSHVIAGCKEYLDQGRYTWRHNSVLSFIARTLSSVKDVSLYVDLDGWESPCVITGMELRPDLLAVKGATLYIMELTVGFEANIEKNAARKEAKYEELSRRLNDEYDEVNFVNVSMGSIGLFGKSCNSFLTMMSSIGIGEKSSTYIMKTAANIALRCSYYIFCRRNKQWTEQSLLQL